ncbi:hypothetical protein SLS54_001767 [Diplodia seriata]
MCLLDTADGALMMSLYTSASLARDRVAILYYSIVLTVVTVIVALVIGVIQLLTLVLNVAEPTGRFWDGVERAGDSYEIIGGSICGSFLVFGALSVLLYKPWRRRVDEKRERNNNRVAPALLHQNGDEEDRNRDPQDPASVVVVVGNDGSREDDGGGGKTPSSRRGGGTPYGTVEIVDDEESQAHRQSKGEGSKGKGGGQHISAREVGERA